ncbi:hypothetical protein C0995_007090 [Termitomyces sp. Mi166|nr:hypothetical protein C0995_007090 [Termitomyces sp. Mi166\
MADEKVNETFEYDDPSTRIWSSYISHAEKLDRNLAQSWKGDMDSLLIFAGLFSASVTAFIIESYKTLSPDPSYTTNVLLAQISRQLATMSNASTSFNTSEVILSPFEVPTSALICNTLWFLSLGFSLACALSATLVEQWVRNYLQATESRLAPHERARIIAYLYHGVKKFRMATLVEAIPLLLHVSLLLFFLGLVEFLRPVNIAMSYLSLGMLITFSTLYALATFLPIFWHDCPYHTPLSDVWWKVMKILCVLRGRNPKGSTVLISGGIASTREIEAMQISPERNDRDFEAMTWMLRNIRHESEFEAFVEVIPRAVAGPDYSAKLLLRRLHYHRKPSARLGHLIPRLLISCTGGILDPAVSQRRAATCLAAIWSLSMMTVQMDSWGMRLPVEPVPPEKGRFDEFTLRDIQTVRSEIPAISDLAISAAIAIARDLLDRYLDHVMNQEILLQQLIETREKKDLVYIQKSGQRVPRAPHSGDPQRLIRGIHHDLKMLENFLVLADEIAVPKAFLLVSRTYIKISALLGYIFHPRPDTDTLGLASQALAFFHQLRAHLKQAGFSLLADYASSFARGHTLPYEAYKTLCRLFLRLDLEHRVSIETQTRVITCLDDTFNAESGTRIPQNIVNVLLGMVRVLKDPTCVLKAKAIINRGMKFFPGEDEARGALEVLEEALPRPQSTLYLFTSHLYANVKVDKGQARLGNVHN